MRRLLAVISATLMALLLSAGPALACGGLIGANGAVNLLRTTTMAGYHDGVEHYITAFEYAGGEAFGSIIPLPGVPSDVVKGGSWTLQRLVRETTPPAFKLPNFGSTLTGASATVIFERKIDALDITVLKGGGDEVGLWAKEHGFRLPPDAPEVLDFYAARSQIFLAASFDPARAEARGQQVGDGTPIHITIPTTNPWVPLRILALGKNGAERVEADIFLLNDRQPAILPGEFTTGLAIAHNTTATSSLLADLRTDEGMEWVPDSAWLTKVALDINAADLKFDLAIDVSGANHPSPVAAGFTMPGGSASFDVARLAMSGLTIILGVAFVLILMTRRSAAKRVDG